MKSFTAAFVSALAALPYVAAHGSLNKVVIDGKEYAGNAVNSPSPFDSAIRMISQVDPVKGANNPDLACGQSAQPAKLTVPANPGSQLQMHWVSGAVTTAWPHNTGPIINYMASCGSDDCSNFDASKAQWFKISQDAKTGDGNNWVQGVTLYMNQPYNLTLPQNLQPGGYLLRHEVIALQLAVSQGGAEFYPSCTQLLIGGGGSGKPNATVSFPGAYSDSDPGILDPNVYTPGSPYTFPGGPISNLAAAAPGTGSAGNGTDPAPASSAAPAATPSASASVAGAAPAASPSADPSPSGSSTCRISSSKKRMVKRHSRLFGRH